MKIIHKYKLFGYINTLPRSGRRLKLSPTDDRKLVRMFRNHQGSSLSWNGNCWNASVTLLSEVSFTSPWTTRVPTKTTTLVPELTTSNEICSFPHGRAKCLLEMFYDWMRNELSGHNYKISVWRSKCEDFKPKSMMVVVASCSDLSH